MIQLSLLTVSVCIGAAALVVRGAKRSADSRYRIQVDPVSSTWLADLKTRHRPE